ncbi:MAG TPA: M50 family metallopeptidase [Patescibacteria group bacterium]|nr:M50 family metallopeptidase [Patescibacteria group bacterium]
MIVTVLVFLLILTILVLIHEAGHFFVAKFFNIKVEEFGVGFPPRAWGKKVGETLYSINWLPIGGFVRLYGEDEAGSGRISIGKNKKITNTNRAFFAKPWWQRFLVGIAGVVMNFLLAVLIFSFMFAFVGVAIPGHKVIVGQVAKGSPSELAGLKPGDTIEYVGSVKITDTQQLIAETKKHLGQEIVLKLNSNGKVREVRITPRTNYPKGEGPIGVAISQNAEIKKYSWYEAPVAGTKEAIKASWLIISAFGTVISQLFTQGAIPKDIAGPIGIAQLTGQVVQVGPFAVLYFISILSLNLAILNVLPIPALDGGRLFFILIEAVTRKKVHPKFESYAHAIGMALLLALIALVTLHDISRIISGQSLIPGSR